MNITYCQDYDHLSQLAGSFVIDEISLNKDLLLCAATGHSPKGFYQQLSSHAQKDKNFFNQLRIIKLDEWGGVPMGNPITCEAYIQKNIIVPLQVSADRYLTYSSDPENPIDECRRMQDSIKNNGPIDICILGLGVNGHIGLNEPAPFLTPNFHKAQLSEPTLHHQMIQSVDDKPAYGLTLGMHNILNARKIILLITGKGKEVVTKQLLSQRITTQLPASFLWLHQQVECLIDKSSHI